MSAEVTRITRRFVGIATVLVAAAMVATILVPAEFWDSPEVDAVYEGFDPILMHADAQGVGVVPGALHMDAQSLELTAPPGSVPTVHLSTGPLSTSSEFSFEVVEAQPGTSPLAITIWSPYQDHRLQLVLESLPSRRVLMRRLEDGEVVREEALGTYEVGQRYDVRTTIDRSTSSAAIVVSSTTSDAYQRNALVVESGVVPFESHVLSDAIPVVEGEAYELSAVVRGLASGIAGLSLEWLDADGQRISIDSEWEPVSDPSKGWTGRSLVRSAPPSASFARVELAAAEGGRLLFGDVSLTREDQRAKNLLANGSFENGTTGWRRAEGDDMLEVRRFDLEEFAARVTSDEWPELFAARRMALSVTASAETGLATTRLRDYAITLTHQRWLANRVADLRLTAIVLFLAVAGVVLLLISNGPSAARAVSHFIYRTRRRIANPITVRQPALFLALGLGVVGFLAGNALLSHLGSVNADIIGARVWGYVSAIHRPEDLYFLPNVSSAEAIQWSGLPLQEAGYPYGITMAYVTAVIGQLWNAFFAPLTGPLTGADFDYLTRGANAVFVVADTIVIFLILRRMSSKVKAALLIALAFMFNPAVWFAGSVWASSQAISLLFILLAIYFAEVRRLGWAWTLLFLAMMTRPQNLIPCAVLAIYLLREHPVRLNLLAGAKAVVAVYLVLLPFALTISPTLPADNIFNAYFMHLGTGNDDWTMPLSWGGLSIWPLVVPLLHDVHGVDRILFPATTPVWDGVTFHRLGTVALVAFLGWLVAWFILRAGAYRNRDYVLYMAVAAMALFVLPTGVPTYHYILALTLTLLTYRSIPRLTYIVSVVALSATSFLSMYAMGAYWLSPHDLWGVGLYDPSNLVTQLMASVADSDLFILISGGANLFVLLAMTRYLLWPMPMSEAGTSALPVTSDGAPIAREDGVEAVETTGRSRSLADITPDAR